MGFSEPQMFTKGCNYLVDKNYHHALRLFNINVTGFGKIRLINGWVQIDFLPEKASTKFNYIAFAKYENP